MPFSNASTLLWTCRRCGHRFVTRNMWHSCSQGTLEAHVVGKSTRASELYKAFVKQFIEVTVIPQKTRISFQVRVRFAGAVIRKEWVECTLWLKRSILDARFHRMEKITARDYVYYLRLTNPSQLDQKLREYLREAYEVGCQFQ